MFRLGISNYTKNHCQHNEYLATNSFVRTSDQLEHIIGGLRVSEGSLAMLTNIGLMCAKLLPRGCVCVRGEVRLKDFEVERKSRKVCGTNVS